MRIRERRNRADGDTLLDVLFDDWTWHESRMEDSILLIREYSEEL